MTSNISVIFKKYSVPVLFLIAGLVILILGIKEKQDMWFMVASIMMFVAGGASILYSSGKLKSTFLTIFGVLAGIAATIAIYVSYASVGETVEYQKNYKYCRDLAKQNLEDIRFVQKLHAEQNGVYIKDWASFVDFVKNGEVDKVISEGVVPSVKITPEERDYLYGNNQAIDNNMTEEEAYKLSKWTEGPRYNELFKDFKRDTIQVSLLESKFMSKSYKSNREQAGFYAFSPDSLPVIPFTSQEWVLETADSVVMGDIKVPAIKVSGFIPFAEIKGKNGNKEEMFFGTLSSGNLTGSWEE